MKFPAAHVSWLLGRSSFAEGSNRQPHGPHAGNFFFGPALCGGRRPFVLQYRVMPERALRREAFLEAAHDHFGRFLAGRKLRYTAERRAVVDVVFAKHRHFEADDLVMWTRGEDGRVSRATIYRTLELLVKSGLVRQMTFGDKSAQHYEQVLGTPHHDHLICIACGRVQEVFSADLEREQDALCARHGFEVHHHNLEVFGLCRKCRAAGAGAKPPGRN